MGNWSGFAPYGGLHLTSVLACIALIAAVVRAGRASGSKVTERLVRRSVAYFGLAEWAIYNTAWNWHGIDLREGLPLQLCDVAGVIAPLALLTRNGFAIDREEFQPGVICLATVLRNHSGAVVGALGASAPSMRADDDRVARMRAEVVAAARELSAELGEPAAQAQPAPGAEPSRQQEQED